MMPDVRPWPPSNIRGSLAGGVDTHVRQGPSLPSTMGHRDFGPNKKDPLQDPNLGRMIIQAIDWVAAGQPGPRG